MAKQSISISLEPGLLAALDGELRQVKADRQQNRSAAVSEALELWLQHRRLGALRQTYRQLARLEGGDLEAASVDAAAMAQESFDG
ncbi:MAG: ribbon-helix-helix domain-containing protein [Cyanobacteria bacterium]|nr:ribbon-helix-helix domain-containing protein [Cyanobacteriota bacterium]